MHFYVPPHLRTVPHPVRALSEPVDYYVSVHPLHLFSPLVNFLIFFAHTWEIFEIIQMLCSCMYACVHTYICVCYATSTYICATNILAIVALRFQSVVAVAHIHKSQKFHRNLHCCDKWHSRVKFHIMRL